MENGNNLMIFEGNKVEVFEFNGKILFNPKDIGKCLGLTEAALKKQIQRMNDKQVIKLKNSDFSKEINHPFRKLHNTGENFITERGVYNLLGSSKTISSDKKQEFINFVNKITGKEIVIAISSRFEIEFGQKLKNTFNPLNIEIESQKPMLNGKYRIDFYLPEFNLAIEYDEEQHKYHQEEDKQREEEIKKVLGCKFIRLDYKQDDNYNIGLVLKEIMGR